jgi:hypothetical protein
MVKFIDERLILAAVVDNPRPIGHNQIAVNKFLDVVGIGLEESSRPFRD